MQVEDFECPICRELLISPRTLPCGHTFCFHCLEFFLANSEAAALCPIDRKPLPQVIPEVSLLLQHTISSLFQKELQERIDVVLNLRTARLFLDGLYACTRDSNNALMVKALAREETILSHENLIVAMLRLPRGEFVPRSLRDDIYHIQPNRIHLLEFNVSAPNMHAFCLQKLNPKQGQRFLDVGVGTGIVAALAAQLVGKTGVVHGIDLTDDIVEFARRNIDMQERWAEDHLCKVDTKHKYLTPGCVFSGTSFETANPTRIFHTKFMVDRMITATTFEGRLFTTTLAHTVTFVRGTVEEDSVVKFKEESVLCTRAERVPWVPCEYQFKLSPNGKELIGGYGHPSLAQPKSTGKITLTFMVNISTQSSQGGESGGSPLQFDNIELFVGNVFDMAKADWPTKYDCIHVGAACEESLLSSLVELLNVDGKMILPIQSEMVLITKGLDGTISRENVLEVRFGPLIPPKEPPAPIRALPRRKLMCPERFLCLPRPETPKLAYVTKCCRKPVIEEHQLLDCSRLHGGTSAVMVGTTVVFCHSALGDSLEVIDDVCIRSEVLNGDVHLVRCRECKLALGMQYKEEPRERGSVDESYLGKFAFVREFLLNATDGEGTAIKCKICDNVLGRTANIVTIGTTSELCVVNSLTGIVPVDKETEVEGSFFRSRLLARHIRCNQCDQDVGLELLQPAQKVDFNHSVWFCGRFCLKISEVTGLPAASVTNGDPTPNLLLMARRMFGTDLWRRLQLGNTNNDSDSEE
eukprot:PhF_6_TR25253/c0_g1_i1/m.34772